MKNHSLFLLAFLLFINCKNANDKDASSQKTETKKERSLTEKIADAHGYEHWKKINKLQFTLNVDTDKVHFKRHWIWEPKTNAITSVREKDTVSYKRTHTIDSALMRTDRGFINDKYWLLAPFNLIWDADGYTHTHTSKALAPMSKREMQKLTIVYTSEGGYTPGNAYDLYFEDDLILKEWVYRKGNSPEPSLTTSWEDYEDFNGLKIAKTRKKSQENWTLTFTNIEVRQ